MADRETAIKEFLQVNDMEERLGQALGAVVARKPNAVLIFWEDDKGYGALTVPHSHALAFGLVQKAYEILVEEDDDAGNGDSSDSESME